MTSAVLHAEQLRGALVELVVAHGVQVEADRVHCLDRRLVVEQAGQQRAGSDDIARRDHDRVLVGLLERAHMGGEVLGPAGVDGADPATRAGWRLDVAVEVVQRQDLDFDLRSVLDDRRRRRLRLGRDVVRRHGRKGDQRCRGDADQNTMLSHVTTLPMIAVVAHHSVPSAGPGTVRT
jgi:hypothetical protein